MGSINYYWFLYGSLVGHQFFTAQGWAHIFADIRESLSNGDALEKLIYNIIVDVWYKSAGKFLVEHTCDGVWDSKCI